MRAGEGRRDQTQQEEREDDWVYGEGGEGESGKRRERKKEVGRDGR